jgi:UDP-N-acetylmuramoyl-L-alanyl-D-glutamate--2,6-diaminopimelate ligase
MKLHTLLEVLPIYTLFGKDDPDIMNIRNHHEKVKQGDLFICIQGLDVDSHTLAKTAVNNGAVALITERLVEVDVPVIVVPDSRKAMAVVADFYYKQPSHDLLLVGVTGTNGKTTTTHLIERIYTLAGLKTGLIGTLYVKMGDELEQNRNTTPDSLTLQQTFRRFCNANVHAAVMEVSSHALVQGRVHGCDYDIAVFTNLSQDHLDYHKTMEEYRSAKGLLFAQLGNAYFKKNPKFAVINMDDSSADYFI